MILKTILSLYFVFSFTLTASAGLIPTEISKLIANDGANGDQFGVSIALDGNTVVVGSRLDDDNGAESGSAYVYIDNGTSWTQQAKLIPADGAANDQFGFDVAIDGDTLVVSAVRDNGSCALRCAARR